MKEECNMNNCRRDVMTVNNDKYVLAKGLRLVHNEKMVTPL
jgi:hypothetical protein